MSIPFTNFTQLTPSDPFLLKRTGERAVVGITCCLSILGSLLIVLSYVCFKSMRSKTRQILVHLSLMDLGVALANLIGDAVYFDQYLYRPDAADGNTDTITALCKTQAFFAAYFTYGSILWTVALATYIYFLTLYCDTKLATRFLKFSYVFCYVLPFLLSLWLVLTGRLGYAPYDSTGWCSLILKDPETGRVELFIAVFASDLWFYLAIVLIILLYLAVRIYTHEQLHTSTASERGIPKRYWEAVVNKVDYKFLLIPIVFVLLRIWTIIVNIVYIYAQVEPSDLPTWLDKTLVYMAGIGDSGQGFANAILFVVLTRKVRQHFLRCIRCQKEELQADEQAGRRGSDADLNSQSQLMCESFGSSYAAVDVQRLEQDHSTSWYITHSVTPVINR